MNEVCLDTLKVMCAEFTLTFSPLPDDATLVEGALSILRLYFDALKTKFDEEEGEDWLLALRSMKGRLFDFPLDGVDHKGYRLLRLQDRGSELAERAVRMQLDFAFCSLQSQAQARLDELHKLISSKQLRVRDAAEACFQGMLTDMSACTLLVTNIISSASDLLHNLKHVFDNLVKFRLSGYYTWFAQLLSQDDASKKKVSGYFLALAFLSMRISKFVAISHELVDPREIQQLQTTCSKALLRTYVEFCAEECTDGIRQEVLEKDWLGMTEPPAKISSSIIDLLLAVKQVDDELQDCKIEQFSQGERVSMQALPSPASPGEAFKYSRKRKAAHSPKSMFKEKLLVFAQVELTRNSILDALLRVCFKTMYECVRRRTLNVHGFHQMQLDVFYLSKVLPKLVHAPSQCLLLCEEIVASAQDRTIAGGKEEYWSLQKLVGFMPEDLLF